MIRISTTEAGLRLDVVKLWDRKASEEMVDVALGPAMFWQTGRGRGADGKKFKPYAESYIKRQKKKTRKSQKVTLKKTGRLLTVVNEGKAATGGLIRFVNEKSSGFKLNYQQPGFEGYLYAWSVRRFLGWPRKGLTLAKKVIESNVTRLLAEHEGGRDRGDWPGAAQPPSRPAAAGRRAA